MTTKHICLFGGPGTGKSTTAAGLFYLMKSNNLSVELVTEYAKDVVYSKDPYRISDQLYLLAKQHHKWFKLENVVNYTVNDGPFLNGLVYNSDPELNRLILSKFLSYNTINIFLERDLEHHPYQTYGRSQSLEESLELDRHIRAMFFLNNIPFNTVKVSPTAHIDIFNILKEDSHDN